MHTSGIESSEDAFYIERNGVNVLFAHYPIAPRAYRAVSLAGYRVYITVFSVSGENPVVIFEKPIAEIFAQQGDAPEPGSAAEPASPIFPHRPGDR